jgi:hypothetical protein
VRFLEAVITAEREEELEELRARGSLPAFSAALSRF